MLKTTGAPTRLPGGLNANQLPDAALDLPSGFLANLGRPARESSCECERSTDLRLGSVMALLSGPAVADAIGDPANALAKLVAAQPDDRKLIDDLFTRILSRPAGEPEMAKVLESWGAIDRDHATLLAATDAKEKEQAPFTAKAEADRALAIDTAKKELARFEAEIAPRLAEAEKKRVADLAVAQVAAVDYEQKNLAAAQAVFETTVPAARTYTGWIPLDVAELRATNDVVLTKLPDGSIKASGARPKTTDYVLKCDTKVAGITGLLIEALTTPDETNFGPGRFPTDGNFVLGELDVKVGAFGAPSGTDPVKLTGAIADFSQVNFEVAKAIDGKKNDGNNGWAVSGQFGVPHSAAFAFAKPVGDEKGVRLRIEMNQPRECGFSLARFRIWVTTSNAPLNIGLPAPVADALKKPAPARSKEEQSAIAAYWTANDPELRKRRLTAGKLELPLPADPGLAERRAAIVRAEEPVRLDPKLVQLRADSEQSKAQLASKRLTGVQDLTWALINTPAFLFNH